jgi:hypothetical protein
VTESPRRLTNAELPLTVTQRSVLRSVRDGTVRIKRTRAFGYRAFSMFMGIEYEVTISLAAMNRRGYVRFTRMTYTPVLTELGRVRLRIEDARDENADQDIDGNAG